MAYNDNAVTDKLSSLNESQDSIVAVAQWIMFWRRHASRTAQLWLSRLQDAPTLKRLNLIYLANEVVQQSRARGKTDFLLAFEPIISDATAIAYKGASMEVQQKLKRVVDVWRQRKIFDPNTQTTIEKRVEEIDRLRGGGGVGSNGIGSKGKLGGSLFGGSVAPELDVISQAVTAVSRAEVTIQTAVPSAETEYSKMMDPEATSPTPPVHAARLNTLLKSLASAQSAVEGCIKARQDIVAGLEKLLEKHKSKLVTDEEKVADITTKRDVVESKKKEVEDHIMQGLSTQDAGIAGGEEAVTADPSRPEPEGFTPPPPDVEAFTPPPQGDEGEAASFIIGDADAQEQLLSGLTGAETIQEQPVDFNEPPPNTEPPLVPVAQLSEDPRLKRRKMSHQKSTDMDEAIFGAGSLGVDEERISALLGN